MADALSPPANSSIEGAQIYVAASHGGHHTVTTVSPMSAAPYNLWPYNPSWFLSGAASCCINPVS